MNIKAVQVDFGAGSLNSHDVFIVCSCSGRAFFVWCGKGSTGDEREAAKLMLCAQKREPEMVIESQERDEFWAALNGRNHYGNGSETTKQRVVGIAPPHSPIARLFEVSAAATPGKINVSEIYQFGQDDLSPTDVMILDTWSAIFVWIGASESL
jgi:hypothetical protein